jgi:Family of unknown function (DUF5681)
MAGSSTSNVAVDEAGVVHQQPDHHLPGHDQPADYEVGYGRPPVEHRFKPGNNANPKGRKKKTRNRKVIISEILLEPITVKEGGEIKTMSRLEALLKKMITKALAGDNKAALTMIGIAQREGLLTPDQEEGVDPLSDNDMAIVQDYMQRLNEASGAVENAAGSLTEGRLNHES